MRAIDLKKLLSRDIHRDRNASANRAGRCCRHVIDLRPHDGAPTNLAAEQSDAASTVRAYKNLAVVERAFRSLKTVDLELRPVYHWTAPRVRAHVLLCMLAYYLEWHMRQCLAPILFDDHDPVAREAQRTSPVAKARPSTAARDKAKSKQTDPALGPRLPVHSLQTLLADLGTLTRNNVRIGASKLSILLTNPTPAPRFRTTGGDTEYVDP